MKSILSFLFLLSLLATPSLYSTEPKDIKDGELHHKQKNQYGVDTSKWVNFSINIRSQELTAIDKISILFPKTPILNVGENPLQYSFVARDNEDMTYVLIISPMKEGDTLKSIADKIEKEGTVVGKIEEQEALKNRQFLQVYHNDGIIAFYTIIIPEGSDMHYILITSVMNPIYEEWAKAEWKGNEKILKVLNHDTNKTKIFTESFKVATEELPIKLVK